MNYYRLNDHFKDNNSFRLSHFAKAQADGLVVPMPGYTQFTPSDWCAAVT